ncbi:hypothetical protein T492DRAFT_1057015 [Pavlovales sp. CCMP2436]|nr:hypothetical protein T492DRAFT_1057015 [Pavlovales sp. CCMP2436]
MITTTRSHFLFIFYFGLQQLHAFALYILVPFYEHFFLFLPSFLPSIFFYDLILFCRLLFNRSCAV